MQFETSNDRKACAVLEGDTLRAKHGSGNVYAVKLDNAGMSAWQSDKSAFDESVKSGGRLFYPGDTLTIRF